jgi:tRNA-dihydrouridine synthase C
MVEHFFETGLPVIVQLMGTHEDVLAEAAYRFVEAGAVGINFNFACPSKTVLKHGSGGGFLRQPERMVSMVEATARRVPGIPVSIKMRTGYSSPDECIEVLKALYQSSCSMVAVHHRTVLELYKKVEGRLDRWLTAREHWPDRDFIVSGDMMSVSDVMGLPKDITGVMIARGLIKRPLLITEIREAMARGEERGDLPVDEKVALDFLEHLATISCEDPEKYWSSKYMLEICRHTLGRESWLFKQLITAFKTDAKGPEMLKLCARYREEQLRC